jgi:amino acid permease
VGDDRESRGSDTADALFSRDEVLGGLPARRAHTLLFLVESRTAHLVARARQAMELVHSEEAERERDLAFVEAFSLGREPPLRPTIQDLERQAPHWAPLVPGNPQVRAALAHLLGEKYAFTAHATPGIRQALGLDTEPVQRAHQRLYRQPLETIFVARVTPVERLRWAGARLAGWLESRPPFWTVFALTLTEAVGSGILALPIALASVGPLAGVGLLVVFGLVNVLTIAAMAEAIARSGAVRYGNAFFGRLVIDYLGMPGSVILSAGLSTICVAGLVSYYIGLPTTLERATSVPAVVWAGLLFLVGMYYLSRRSIHTTVASALLVGAINLGLILGLCLLAATHIRATNLLYVDVPFLAGGPFDPSPLQLIFGVVLLSYFGHLSTGNCARVVLQQDPSARSLIWGSVAAQLAAIVIYCGWVVTINGAVEPPMLAQQAGTALAPLADRVGPAVHVLGSVFVILAMGMGSIHLTLSLGNLVRERLPGRSRPILTLARRRGKLLFESRGETRDSLHVGLTFLGLEDDRPRVRLDVHAGHGTRRLERTLVGRWEADETLGHLADGSKHGLHLAVEAIEADDERVRLEIDSSVVPTYEGGWDTSGLRMGHALDLPDPEQRLVTWMLRQGEVSLAAVASQTGQGERTARGMLEGLVEQGLVRRLDGPDGVRYRVGLARARGHTLPPKIWQALDPHVEMPPANGDPRPGALGIAARRARDAALGPRGRFLLSACPVLAIFLFTEWLFLIDAGSFAKTLSIGGVIAGSIVAGVFPTLMLISSERKSDFVLKLPFRLHRQTAVKEAIAVFFLASLFLHGLIIWDGPLERAGALLAGVLLIAAILRMIRRGAFATRTVVELREDPSGEGQLAVTTAGRPSPAEVQLQYGDGEQVVQAATGEIPRFASLRAVTIRLPASRATELKVWAHRLTPEGDSESLSAQLEVHATGEPVRFDLKLSEGQVLLPSKDQHSWLRITLPRAPGS